MPRRFILAIALGVISVGLVFAMFVSASQRTLAWRKLPLAGQTVVLRIENHDGGIYASAHELGSSSQVGWSLDARIMEESEYDGAAASIEQGAAPGEAALQVGDRHWRFEVGKFGFLKFDSPDPLSAHDDAQGEALQQASESERHCSLIRQPWPEHPSTQPQFGQRSSLWMWTVPLMHTRWIEFAACCAL